MIKKVISGGQTGADRGGLDAAIELGIPHGGWAPYGMRAEDGGIPEKYKLRDSYRMKYSTRTVWNVRDSDATIVFVKNNSFAEDDDELMPFTPGSALTVRVARNAGKPVLTVDLARQGEEETVELISSWLENCSLLGKEIEVLNVAGSRESKVKGGIQAPVRKVMIGVLQRVGEIPEISEDQSVGSSEQVEKNLPSEGSLCEDSSTNE